jgi:hypothetical protein
VAGLKETLAAFAVLGAIGVVGLNSASAQSVRVTDDWMVLRPPDGGFHVLIPPDWKEDNRPYSNNSLSFRPRKSSAALAVGFINCKAGAVANPAIAASTQESLDAAVSSGPAPPSAIKELLAALGKDAVVRENGWLRVASHPAYFIVVSGTSDRFGATIHAVASEVVLVRPGRMFSLVCTAGARTAEQAETAWNTWRPVFLAIMSTFDSESH